MKHGEFALGQSVVAATDNPDDDGDWTIAGQDYRDPCVLTCVRIVNGIAVAQKFADHYLFPDQAAADECMAAVAVMRERQQ